ncbi:MAG: hypothetical protein ACXWBQ_00225 [Usitatibacter sp.]
MKVLFAAMALAVAAVPTGAAAAAADVRPVLELKPKAALMVAPAHESAPFVVAASQPELHFAQPPQRAAQSNSSCNADHDLCYDQNNGHIVYKPARQLMPVLPGLTPENISVKRDRIIFRYSF